MLSDDDYTYVRLDASRRFNIGDKVVWNGCDLGTVVRKLDEHTLVIDWDDPRIGRTVAPAWSYRLRHIVQPTFDDDATDPEPWKEFTKRGWA
jgi:hypothetical protein